MAQIIYYAAFIANIALIFGSIFFLFQSISAVEVIASLLLMVAPLTSMLALYTGPDLEERRLQRMLNKIRIKKELQSYKKQG